MKNNKPQITIKKKYNDKNNLKSRSWISTIYTEPLQEQFEKAKSVCLYAVGQLEKGNATGRLHLQLFTNFHSQQRLSALNKIWPQSHHEIAKDPQESIIYCQKEDTRVDGPWIHGIDPITRQKKSYMLSVQEAKLKTEQELQELSCYNYIIAKKALSLITGEPYEHDNVRGIWIYGKPGVGKSRKAIAEYPNAFRKSQNKWWDGYQGQQYVILDDLDHAGGQTLSHYIKIWADRYPCTGEIKGGTVNLRHTKFVVTSNYQIKDLWSESELCNAISRRFEIIHMISYP